MSDVFISYAREDTDFMVRVRDALTAAGREVWVDDQILAADRWRRAIEEAIEGAAAIVVLVTNSWLTSAECAKELAVATFRNKRVIPLCHEDPPEGAPRPALLAELNWIMARPADDFDGAIAKLIDALDTDIELVRDHTRILVRAKAWEMAGKKASPLLRGEELRTAEQWIERSASGRGPEPTDLHRQFVRESRRVSNRRRRITIGVAAVGLVLAVTAATLWFVGAGDRARGESRRLAAQARDLIATNPDEAARVAAEAVTKSETPEARKALIDALRADHVIAKLPGGLDDTAAIVVSDDGTGVALGNTWGELNLVDVQTGSVHIFDEFANSGVTGLDWSGSRLAVSTTNDRVVIVDTESNGIVTSIGPLAADSWEVGGKSLVALNDDATRLLTFGDSETELWDAESGHRIATVSAQSASGGFTINGDAIVIDGNALRLFDPHTGAQKAEAAGDPIVAADLSPNANAAAVQRLSGAIEIWDLANLTKVGAPYATGGVGQISVSNLEIPLIAGARPPVGSTTVAIVHSLAGDRLTPGIPDDPFRFDDEETNELPSDAPVEIADPLEGRRLATAELHGENLNAITHTPDGNIVIVFDTQALTAYDAATGLELSSTPISAILDPLPKGSVDEGKYPTARLAYDSIHGIAYVAQSPLDGPTGVESDLVAVQLDPSNALASSVSLVDLGGVVDRAALAPLGNLALMSNEDGAYLVDVTTGDLAGEPLPTVGHVSDSALSPGGDQVAVSDGRGVVSLIDVDSRDVRTIDETERGSAADVQFSADGNTLLIETTAPSGWELHTIDINTEKAGTAVPLEQSRFAPSVAVSADGRLMAASDGDSTSITIWDTQSGAVVATADAKNSGPRTANSREVTFSSDGKRLVYTRTSTLIYDTASGQELLKIPEAQGGVLSPDGALVAGLEPRANEVAQAELLALWDAKTGKKVLGGVDTGAQNPIISFSSDGGFVSAGRTIWRVPTGEVIARLDGGFEQSTVGAIFARDIPRLLLLSSDAARVNKDSSISFTAHDCGLCVGIADMVKRAQSPVPTKVDLAAFP